MFFSNKPIKLIQHNFIFKPVNHAGVSLKSESLEPKYSQTGAEQT